MVKGKPPKLIFSTLFIINYFSARFLVDCWTADMSCSQELRRP